MAHSIFASKEELEAIIQRQRRKILELESILGKTEGTPSLTSMDVEEAYGIGYKDGGKIFNELLKEAFAAGWYRGAEEAGSTAGDLGFELEVLLWEDWIKEKNN